jgi:hypothetical protein
MSIITDIQLQVDETQGPVFWEIEQLYDAANQAQLNVWSSLKDWQRGTSTMTVTTGQDLVAFDTTTIMIPQFIIYNGVKIFPTTHAMLQDWQNNWKNEGLGRPNWVVLWDAEHFRLFPRPDQTYNFVVWGTPWPTEITDGNHDIVGVDPLVRRAIVLQAAALLLEDSQPLLADAKLQEAMDFRERYARQQRNVQGSNIMRLRPGVAWQVAQGGDIRMGRKYMGTP